MAETNYYDVLGVSRSATAEEIKKAFRHKARECHPDVSDAPDAEDQFKALNAAYDVLSSPEKRSRYDQFGEAGVSGAAGGGGYGGGGGFGGGQYVDIGDLFGGGMGGGVDLGDLFSAFMGGTRRGGGRAVRREGRDMGIGVQITLEEAATGIEREVTVDRLAPCADCNATGSADGAGGTRTCPDCNGSGQRITVQRTFLGSMQTQTPCARCKQSGQIIENPCIECEGSGRVIDRDVVTVDIPAGIHDSQHIRMRDLGEAGIRGAVSGDLIIEVHIAAHERFERERNDLHMVLPISFTQAALGGLKRIEGLLGEVEVHIPAGAQTGSKVKALHAGMPIIGKDAQGNLYCHIEVVVPRKLSSNQRALLKELSAEFGDTETSVVEHHKSKFDKVKDWAKR